MRADCRRNLNQLEPNSMKNPLKRRDQVLSKRALIKENIHNLQALWTLYGSQPVFTKQPMVIQKNTRWPHRCWIEPDREEVDYSLEQVTHLLGALKEGVDKNTLLPAIIPLWITGKRIKGKGKTPTHTPNHAPTQWHNALTAAGYAHRFNQKAMVLDLTTVSHTTTQPNVQLTQVTQPEEAELWSRLAGEAFDYNLDSAVIRPLIRRSTSHLPAHTNSKLYFGYVEGQPVATGLLLKTGSTIGIHQVGVVPSQQGRGYAYQLMNQLLQECIAWQGRYAVLQASQMGEGLYVKLGFEEQCVIYNYGCG